MKIVEDPKILSAFEKEDEKEIDLKPGKLVEDENIITQFNKLENEEGIENTVKKSLGAIKEFFTGTKRTEYPELPEIGAYKGKGAAKIAAGLLINPNQKAQAEIIQTQIPESKILKDNFDNILIAMPDGKTFYLILSKSFSIFHHHLQFVLMCVVRLHLWYIYHFRAC